MVFTPYPDFLIIYNSHDVSLSQCLKVLPKASPSEGNFWTTKWTISQDETISFEDGWSKFITDNDPIDKDFLLFSYDGSRTFLVSIFRDGLPVKPKAPVVSIQEISDEDEDETAGENDDDDEDVDDSTGGEVTKAHGSSRRSGLQRTRGEAIGDPEMYLDDPSTCRRSVLVIATQVIKDYDLKFGDTIKFIDRFGELEGKFGNWKDRVVVRKWKEIYERNGATPKDVIICEILREGDVVRSIKAHFVKN
ncbi:hypothetical protein N665_0198s0266 [Sinapis alba]|nr:hypothetical protein N665_0198s0266 [Sinapis alba]